jgi:hypothetical protein
MILYLTGIVKVVDVFLAAFWPLLYVASWGIVVYEHIRYKTRLKELEEFKRRALPLVEAFELGQRWLKEV